MSLIALIDQAVADALGSQSDLLTPKGREGQRAHKLIVRKVTKALRESLSIAREGEEGEAPVRPDQPEAQPEYWQCEVWSREWWALFFTTVERQPTFATFLLHQAAKAQKGETAAVVFDRQPSSELIEQMQSYPSDGAAAIKWRHWLNRKNIRLPDWRGKMWIFLPAPEPPDSTAA